LAASDEKLSHDLNAPSVERIRETEKKRQKESMNEIGEEIFAAYCVDREVMDKKKCAT